MKKIAILILLLAITGTIYSQSKKCQDPITDQQFQLKYKQVKNQTSDQKRLFIAKQIVGKYCFSSSQVKEMASLFENDYTRLEFAKKPLETLPIKITSTMFTMLLYTTPWYLDCTITYYH